jgi:cupin fold WbuC family metalloprotein
MRVITEETIAELLSRAFASPRKRTNLYLHHELSGPTNRFLNAGIAGTYVRPHRHRIGKWELLSVMQGSVDVMTFSADGAVKNRVSLSAAGANLVVEISGGVWHSIVFRAPGAVVLEIKPGPYEPLLDKEFANWAPSEDDPAAPSFVARLEIAAVGKRV